MVAGNLEKLKNPISNILLPKQLPKPPVNIN
jgi:hypothetical protein